MSDEELAAYNTGKPLSQMIVCGEDDRSFSRVRRRSCATVEAMYGSAQQADQLGAEAMGRDERLEQFVVSVTVSLERCVLEVQREMVQVARFPVIHLRLEESIGVEGVRGS